MKKSNVVTPSEKLSARVASFASKATAWDENWAKLQHLFWTWLTQVAQSADAKWAWAKRRWR